MPKWRHRAKVDEGAAPGPSRAESAENRELRQRVRLLEQENEVLRRAAAYLSQANRDELQIAIVTWIERTYHRRQLRLGRLTPVEFEVIMNTPAALAA